MKKLVVLTGAGISAESGLQTFRDEGGLWEGYSVYDVATPQAWHKNPGMVQEFYNMRRKAVLEAQPNAAHLGLAQLESHFDVTIITQNIDNLHERAGSAKVLHLHGEITKAQSSLNPELVYPIEGWELKMGDTCELGSQLRPHIVWFGEQVPMMYEAEKITAEAELFAVIGTSLQVYPAAGLLHSAPHSIPKFLIDPKPGALGSVPNLTVIAEKAGTGIARLTELLLH
ncbi:MAG: NAD-dependent deacylase [Bacteroidia bacterium]|nr:NAD-dependent deacylase [Bacteroidia bacterium]